MTVLKERLRTNRSVISFEHESNGWAKGAKGERGESEGRRGEGAARRRGSAEKGRRGEEAEK